MSPVSCDSVGEILTTLRICTLRNAISHTGNNSTDERCTWTGTEKGVLLSIVRADKQTNRKNKGKIPLTQHQPELVGTPGSNTDLNCGHELGQII